MGTIAPLKTSIIDLLCRSKIIAGTAATELETLNTMGVI
jgi:hypothetical protein